MRISAKITLSLLLLFIAAMGLLGVAPRQRTIFYGQTTSTGGGGGGGALPVLVNTARSGSMHNSTTTPTAAFSLTTGSALICGLAVTNGYTLSGGVISDGTNSFTQIGTIQIDGGSSHKTYVFYAKNVTGNASEVVTATWTATAVWSSMLCLQYSGANTSSPIDSVSQIQGNGTGTSYSTNCNASCTMTIANNNTVVLGFTTGTACGSPPTTGMSMNSSSFTDEVNDGTNPCSGTTPSFVQSAWDHGFATTFSAQTGTITQGSGQSVYNIFGIHP